MKKTILTIVAMLLLGTNAFAQQPYDLQAQQQKVNNIKKTQQGQEIFKLVDEYSSIYKVDSNFVKAVILVESGYNPKAVSPCGAKGLMQLMDNTFYARKVGNNPYSIRQNIHAGVKHIAGLSAKYKGNMTLVASAYNAGGGTVDRHLKVYGRIPSHTRDYVNRVNHFQKSIMF